MIILIPILFLLSIFSISLFQEIFKLKKYNCSIYILITIAIQQIIINFISGIISKPSFVLIATISYCLFFLVLVGFIIYGFYIYKHLKLSLKEVNFKIAFKEYWYKHLLFFISIFIFAIFLIFVQNSFTDTGYYINLSTEFYFQSILPDFNDPYRYATSYYAYASWSNSFINSIPAFYNFLTPFTFYLVLVAYINEAINNQYFKNNKNIFWIQSCFIFPLLLFLVFLNPYIISGNLVIQSSIILIVLLSIKKQTIKDIPFILLFSQFFSITGLIVSNVIFLSISLYLFFFKGTKKYLELMSIMPYSIISIGVLPSLFLNKFSNNVASILIIVGYALIILFSCFFYLTSKIINKKNITNRFLTFNLTETKLYQSKIYFNILSLISCFASLITILYFSIAYKSFDYIYEWLIIVLSCIIFLPIFLFIIKRAQKEEKYQMWYIPLFGLIIIFIFVCVLWIFNIQNTSIWRILYSSIYLTFDGCNPLFIIYLIYTFIQICWLSRKAKRESTILMSTNKPIKQRRWLAISSLFLIIISSLFLIITNTIRFPNKAEFSNFNANVVKNINLFNDDDITILKTLNNQKDMKYATDCMANIYLYNLENCTLDYAYQIYGSTFDGRLITFNRLNFYNAQMFSKDQHLNLNEFIKRFQLILDGNWLTNYLILDKTTEYFASLNLSSLKIINESTNLIILSK